MDDDWIIMVSFIKTQPKLPDSASVGCPFYFKFSAGKISDAKPELFKKLYKPVAQGKILFNKLKNGYSPPMGWNLTETVKHSKNVIFCQISNVPWNLTDESWRVNCFKPELNRTVE